MIAKNTTLSILFFLLVTSLAACSSKTALTQSAEAAPTDSGTVVAQQPTATYLPTVIAESVPVIEYASYPIVDTGQGNCYNDSSVIACPTEGEAFYGQDAQFTGNAPSYTDNGDGTITDNVTGLMWPQSANADGDGDIDAADKLTYDEALAGADSFTLAGYSDWRLPTIKELYSLIDFSGIDPSGYSGNDTSGLVPFIDTDYFDFGYGDASAGERIFDAQYATST
jgi:hypothetical protein